MCLCLRSILCSCFFRIVEKGYYSERDAADAVKQILEAVAVSQSYNEGLSVGPLPVTGIAQVIQLCDVSVSRAQVCG